MNQLTESIKGQITLLERDLVAAEAELEDAALAALEAPADAKAQENLAALKREIEDYNGAIADRKRALKGAEAQGTKTYKQKQLELAKVALPKIEERHVRMEELVREIEGSLCAIAPKLGEFARLAGENHEATWQVLKIACPTTKEATNKFPAISDALRGSAVSSVLVNALEGSGLGHVGPRLSPFVEIRGTGAIPSVDKLMGAARERALAQLSQLVACYEAAIGKKGAK